jgi:hypothetical protein
MGHRNRSSLAEPAGQNRQLNANIELPFSRKFLVNRPNLKNRRFATAFS